MKCAPGGSFDLSVFSFGADDCRLRLVYYDIRLTSTKCEKMGGLATAHPAWIRNSEDWQAFVFEIFCNIEKI